MYKFNFIDNLFIIIFILIIISYIYILYQNNLLFNKNNNQNNKNNISLLSYKNSILFEILEIIILIIVSVLLYKQKQFIICLVFVIALFEHINQILFCYRQDLNSLHIITIVIYFIFMIYAFLKKCYWVIPLLIIGTLIHLISIYYNKPFSGIVCIFNEQEE